MRAQIVVTGGDLTNLRGRVINVLPDGRVEIMPTQLGLTDALTFDAGQLRKFFEVRSAFHHNPLLCVFEQLDSTG